MRLGHVKSSPPDVPCWRCVPAGASGQSEKRQDVACDCLCSPSDTAINWASAIGPRDGNGVRAIGRLLPRPHAWRSRLSFFFARKAIIAPPPSPAGNTQVATEKWQKTGRPLFQGGGFAAWTLKEATCPTSCRLVAKKVRSPLAFYVPAKRCKFQRRLATL